MDIGDLLDNSVVGSLTQKFGIKPEQAKDALDKIVPFVKDRFGGKPGAAEQAKAADAQKFASDPAQLQSAAADLAGEQLLAGLDEKEREAKIAEIAKSTGLHADVVRKLLSSATVATVGAMDAKGQLALSMATHEVIMQNMADASDGKLDGKIHGVPIKK